MSRNPLDGFTPDATVITHPGTPDSTPRPNAEYPIPDASWLLRGDYERDGFDLVITNPAGEAFVVKDYFGMFGEPNLVLESGVGLSPVMVRALMRVPFDGVMFAGEATESAELVQIGRVTVAIGRVVAVGQDGVERVLKRGDALYKGDLVETGARSFVKATMGDGTRFHLGRDGRAALTEYEFDEGAGKGSFEATVFVGGFHYKSGRIGSMFQGTTGSHSKIRTPSAIIGIRGSELDGTVDTDGQTIVVHRSGFLVISDINEQNEVVLEVTGATSVIVLNGSPTFTTSPTPAQVQQLEATLPPPDADDADGTTDAADEADDDAGEDEAAAADDAAGEDAEGDGEAEEGDEETAAADDEEGDEGEDGDGGEGEDADAESGEEGDGADAASGDGAEGGEEGSGDPAETGDAAGQDPGDGAGEEGAGEAGADEGGAGEEGGGDPAGDGATQSGEGAEGAEGGDPAGGSSGFGGDDGSGLGDTGTTGTEGTGGSAESGSGDGGSGGDSGSSGQQGTGPDAPADDGGEILPPNNPPVAEPDAVSVGEGESADLYEALIANDSDPDAGNTFAITAVSAGSAAGTLSLDTVAASLTYSADAHENLGADVTLTETFTYTLTDSGGATSDATVTVTVSGENDSPVASDDAFAVAADETLTVEAADGLLANDADVDDGDILTLVAAGTITDDGAVVAIQPDGSFVFVAGSSTTLTALADGEIFDSMLSYEVSDGQGGSDAAVATISVTGVNDAPVANDDAADVAEKGTTAVNVVGNDTDVDNGAVLSVGSVSQTGGLTLEALELQSDGTLLVTPGAAFVSLGGTGSATVLLSYSISDELGASADGSVELTVIGVNDPPAAGNDLADVGEDDDPAVLDLLGNDADPESGALVISAVDSTGTAGLVTLVDGVVSYGPNGAFGSLAPGEVGIDTFTYTVTDPEGRTDAATVTVRIAGDNDAPVTLPGDAAFDENTGQQTVQLTTFVEDPDGDPLTFGNLTIVSTTPDLTIGLSLDPDGTLNVSTDDIVGLPVGQTVEVELGYDADDGLGLANSVSSGTFTVGIDGADDVPVARSADTTIATQSGTATVDVAALEPEGDVTYAGPVSGPVRGSVTPESGGSQITFDTGADFAPLAEGEESAETFSYTVIDALGQTGTQTVTVTVTGENDAPVAGDDVVTGVSANTPTDIESLVLANDADIDNADTVNIVSVDASASLGTVVLGSLIYDAAGAFDALPEGATATDTFTYVIEDAAGVTDSAEVVVTVVGVNDAPTTVGTLADQAVDEDSTVAITIDPLVFDDVDGDALTMAASGLPATLAFDGVTITGVPLNEDVGTHTVTIEATDSGGLFAATTFELTVINTNDTPEPAADGYTTSEDTELNLTAPLGVLTNDSDPDGDVLEADSVVSLPSGGEVSLAADGSFTYTPHPDFNGADSFTYAAIDPSGATATATVSVTVSPVNDAPVADDDSYTVDEDTLLTVPAGTGSLLDGDTDVEGDPLETTAVVTPPAHGSLSLNVDGSFSYDPDPDFNGSDSFEYLLDDGNGGADTALVTINVQAINDAPVASDDSYSVDEDQTLIVTLGSDDLLLNDGDVDGDTLSVGPVVDNVDNGTLILGGDGTFRYTPDADFAGADAFTYAISDGNGGADNAVVTITVLPVNDAPVVTVPGPAGIDEDSPLAVTGVSVSDIDLAAGSLQVVLTVGHGALTVSGPVTISNNASAAVTVSGSLTSVNSTLASLSYQGDPDFVGGDTLTVTADDQGNTGTPGALTDVDTVSIAVNPVNDAPVLSGPASITAEEDVSLGLAGIVVSDVDADAGIIQVVLDVANGVLGASAAGSAIVVGDGTVSTPLTIDGTLSDVNSTLATLTYLADADYNGPDALNLVVDDQGSTGTGGPLSDTLVIPVTVNAVNDAPLLSVPGPVSGDEETAIAVTGISVADFDAAGGDLEVTLTVVSGVLTASGPATVVSSNGGATLTITGSSSNINTTLTSLDYTGNADFAGVDSIGVLVSDLGNTGSPGPLTDAGSVAVTVDPVNDAPLLSGPGPVNGDEDTAFAVSGIVVADVDAGAGTIRVILDVGNGTLAATGSGGALVVGDGTISTPLTIDGTLTDVNATLASLTYQGDPDYVGSDTVNVLVDDLGSTGTGGPLTDTTTVSITVDPVNDAPVLALPSPVNVDEEVTTGISGIAVSDIDVGAGNVEVTLTVTNGVLNATGPATVATPGTASIMLTGTVADVNTTLTALQYTGDLDHVGVDSLSVAVSDLGNTGSPGPLLDAGVLAITVDPVNDAPLLVAPGPVNGDEDTAFAVTGIVVTDVDAGAGTIRVILDVGNGTLAATGSGGALVVGDGTISTPLTIDGTLTDVNATLASLTYQGDPDYVGGDTVNVLVDDLGSTGSGGPLTDTTTVSITVDPVNDAPVLALPSPVNVDEEVTTGISGIAVSDIDVGAGNVEVTLTVTNGVLNATGPATVATPGTASIMLTGTVADVNTTLTALQYTGDLDHVGAESLSVSVSDLGNTGSPGPLLDAGVLAITVDPVNDAPLLVAPGPVNGDEDTAFAVTGIVVTDVDAGAGTIRVILDVGNGTLAATGSGGALVVGDGTISTPLTIDGTLTDVNATLASLTYQGDPDYVGGDTVNVLVDDLGSTGTGGPLTDTTTVSITIDPVNDAPVLSLPGATNGDEDTSFGVAGISVTDVDSGAGNVEVTLTVSNGTLNASGPASVANPATASIMVTGTVADVNSTLATLIYQGDPDYNGPDSIAVQVSDLGNTGTGGILLDSGAVALTVDAVNDAPAVTAPTSTPAVEELVTGIAGISVVDDGVYPSGSMTVTLTVTSGVLDVSGPAGITGALTNNLQLTGSPTDINSTLTSLTYLGNTNFDGVDTLNITADDGGATGSGGPETDVAAVTINVSGVNDAPVLTVPGPVAATEEVPIGISGVSVADSDSDPLSVQITVSAEHGTLSATQSGAAVVGGDATAIMTVTGNLTDVNATLGSLQYTGDTDYFGADTITVQADDQGNAGTGGSLFDVQTVDVSVANVNDAPLGLGDTFSVLEDTKRDGLLFVNHLTLNDFDADSDPLTVNVTPAVLPAAGSVALFADGTFS